MKYKGIALLIPLLLAACTANDTSIFRSFKSDNNEIGLVDAKQRAIISRTASTTKASGIFSQILTADQKKR